MNKVKFLTILSAILLITNLVLIGFLLSSKPKGGKQGPKNYVIKHLNLNQDQIKEYDNLIEVHQKGRKALNSKILELRNQLYVAVLKEHDDSKRMEGLNELNLVHNELEVLHLTHFAALEKICKGDQSKHFETLVEELTNLFAAKKHKTNK